MQTFEPVDPNFRERVQASFDLQTMMQTLGARISRMSPGFVEIEMDFDVRFTQQDEFLHAGIVTTLMDSACGYAAFSLMPKEARVLSVEFKTNLLAPAKGERFLAQGHVLRPGRTLTVCRGDLYACSGDEELPVATMQATMICLKGE